MTSIRLLNISAADAVAVALSLALSALWPAAARADDIDPSAPLAPTPERVEDELSREVAEQRYDVHKINAAMLTEMGISNVE